MLLSTSHHLAGFAVCSEHLYCSGLMECTQRDPLVLRPRLEELLRTSGSRCCTDTVPLATACFLWLEAHGQPSEILSLGRTNTGLLEEFLKVIF